MKKYLFIFLTLFSFGAFSQGIMTSTEAKSAIVTLSPQNVQSRTTGNLPIQSLKSKRLRLDTLIKLTSEGIGALIANKAEVNYVNTQLATKTTSAQVNTIVAPKMDSTRVKSLLNLKADLSALNSKVETSTFNSVLSTKANSSDLANKANTADVNALLNFKVNNSLFTDTSTALRSSINTKASIASVTTNTTNIATNTADIATKASITLANQKLHTVNSKTALITYQDTDIVYFDGSTWKKELGNFQSNGGDFAGTIIKVSNTVYWKRKLNSGYIIPENFGADESSIDATTQLQQMIDNANGVTIDGLNKLYTVTSLNIPSGTILKNFRLKTKAGSVNFVAPITINGTVTPKIDIILSNIQIDGNRANQTNLPTSGFTEDGGRSGFRIVGYTSNLTIENCSANYCANDAISFVSSTSVTNSDADFCFKNIKINNFTGNYNRRHGMSIDCLDGLEMNNTVFRFNGKDLNTTDAQSVGTRGARTLGFLYGNGVDFEDYGVGTAIQNINIQNINTTNNSYAGFVITSQVNPTTTNFQRRKNIKIDNIVSSLGDDILVGSPANVDYSALKIAGQVSNSSLGYIYENIDITNAKLVGRYELRGVLGAQFSGSIAYSNGFFQAVVNDSKDIFINSVVKGTSKFTNLANTTNYNEIYNSVANRLQLVSTLVDVDAPVGNGYLSNGSLTVANARITSQSKIMLSVQNAIGTQGFLRYSNNPGVGFTITSTSSTDGSLISWLIIN